jgi:type I restriction enzyme, S subunit
VFARTGATTGKSFLIRECPEEAVFASYLIRVRLNDGAEPRFVSHFFDTPDYWRQIAKSARGAAQPGVNATKLKGLLIPLPPLAEQRRIADILDRAAALRAKRQAATVELDALTQSIFLDMMGTLSADVAKPLSELVDNVTVGHVGPTSQYFAERGIPFVRTGNVGRGTINRNGLRFITPEFHARLKKSELRAGDVLISRVISDSVRSAIVPPDLDGANCANVIIVRPGSRISSTYLSFLIHSQESQYALLRRRVGSAQSVINTRVLQGWAIPVPSRTQLDRFDRQITVVDATKHAYAQSLAQFDALFSSLQHRAFRGEL